MKVLVLVPDLKHKGGVTNYYNCLGLDRQEGIDYFMVSSVATSTEVNPDLPVVVSFFRKALYLPLAYLRFLVTAYNYQLIHINPSLNFKAFIRDAGFILLSKMMRKKVLVFFRGWEDSFENKLKKNRFLSLIFKYTYARADSYIVLGKIFKDKIINLGVNLNKRIYIETTIADSRYISGLDLDRKIKSFDKEVNYLFISRILKTKGIYIAMDACAKCNEKYPDRKVTLYVAGDGDDLDDASKYAQRNAYPNVKFIGHVKDETKSNILCKCHIMIFPTSYGEGLPNCILEGMLYGMPVISRPVGGIPDVVEEDVNGFLDENYDSDVYVKLCSRFIEDKCLYERMARANYSRASELFVTDAVKKRLLGIYEELMSNEA